MGWLADETGLEKCAANHVALTPLAFLDRARQVYADREALVDRGLRVTYAALCARVSRLASALGARGVAPGDVVATLLPNVAAQVEAHWGVPAAGAVLNAINIRLDADTVAYILGHGGAKVLLCDAESLPLARAAFALMESPPPLLVECPAAPGEAPSGAHLGYEDLLAEGDPDAPWIRPQDEWESLALNYTSGTTGRPKGVVYHHRGAYLNAMGQVLSWRMVLHPRYLAVVPLFHCNGWCHSWMMPVVGGCVICCREIAARPIFDAIADERVTHFGGAPIILNLLINARPEERREFPQIVEVFTAGAPPAPATLARIEPLGFNVTQVYGLTETYGPATECYWREDWESLAGYERAARKARQGVAMPFLEPLEIWGEDGAALPADGASQGEIVMRGNGVMKGYYRNPEATRHAFRGGWFHSEDLAVQHPEGHVQILDRSKDIIISGGENVSSVEVEAALMAHPAVSLCAVVAMADERWGEVPCAFVELREGEAADEAALIAFVRSRLAGFKAPKRVIFQALPKTSTGKIQKFALRQQLQAEQG